MNVRNTLLYQLLVWLLHWRQMSVALLVLAVVASSLGVVYSAHATRQRYASLQDLQQRQDFLDSEYEKLLLEQSAWAAYTRVDQISRKELKMTSPTPDDIVVVQR